MALNLDVSRTEDIAVVRCRGRIVFGEEADELRRVVLSLLNETKRIVLNLLGLDTWTAAVWQHWSHRSFLHVIVGLKSNLLPYRPKLDEC
jgi:hypothetical protein